MTAGELTEEIKKSKMLYNLNVKIIGDIWEYQDAHDLLIESFKSVVERMLSDHHLSDFRGDINFEYHSNQRKFKYVCVKGKLAGNVNHVFEIDREFQRKYITK